MKKQIIILNGMAESGKGTFVKILKKHTDIVEYSIVDKVKEIMTFSGIDISVKTEYLRSAMNELKGYLEKWDIPYKDVENIVYDYLNKEDFKGYNILSIDMREEKDVNRFVSQYKAKKILVVNNRAKKITSNIADANVYNIEYDYIINNNGSLDELEKEAIKFLDWLKSRK